MIMALVVIAAVTVGWTVGMVLADLVMGPAALELATDAMRYARNRLHADLTGPGPDGFVD
jgi:hypothetical protein